MTIEAIAPGKVIIAGEHFVVENEPGIAAAISLYAKVKLEPRSEKEVIELYSVNYNVLNKIKISEINKERIECDAIFYPFFRVMQIVLEEYGKLPSCKIEISSQIPPKAGLGSSAATAVAFSAALLKAIGAEVDLDEVSELAYEAEKISHGKPSGIDNTVSTYGGVIVFKKSEGFVKLDEVKYDEFKLVLADTGSRESTKKLVEKVRRLKNEYDEVFMPFYHAAGHLTIELAKKLSEGDLVAVGELMNVAHGMLYSLGLSTETVEKLVFTARKAGALGAKITGAGGGGMIIALTTPELAEKVSSKLLNAGAAWVKIVNVIEEGVAVDEI
ncbi:MAG: mevalonate kinase [Thermoprotei archaeon]|nr:MAG: mevalonate kinase [Thermoprotei archaeon]